MPKANLTQAFVANAGCEVGKKKTDWYDTTVTGFVLECRCTGGKTYYLRYEDQGGRQKQHKIGGYQDVTFAAAKKKAQQLRSEVVMGGDPGEEGAGEIHPPLRRTGGHAPRLRQASEVVLLNRDVHARSHHPEVGKGEIDRHR